MSKKIINALKSKVKGLEYNYLKAQARTTEGWGQINSGAQTGRDLIRMDNIIINNRVITNAFIQGPRSNRRSLKAVFTEMFEHAGATVPNDSIIKELITNYNQGGYTGFFKLLYNEALCPYNLMTSCSERISIHMECDDSNRLKCFSSLEDIRLLLYTNGVQLPYNLRSSVEFKLKCNDGNVTYEDGKVLLTIPKELEDYKAGDDSLLDKLTDIINKIVECLKKLCEKWGFKFDTRIEYDSERNIKIEQQPWRTTKGDR